MAEGKGRVCVTGGTGFVGSWIIKSLLENGYSVNTTIRPDSGKLINPFLFSPKEISIYLSNIMCVWFVEYGKNQN